MGLEPNNDTCKVSRAGETTIDPARFSAHTLLSYIVEHTALIMQLEEQHQKAYIASALNIYDNHAHHNEQTYASTLDNLWSSLAQSIVEIPESMLESFYAEEEGLEPYRLYIDRIRAQRLYSFDTASQQLITQLEGQLEIPTQQYQALVYKDCDLSLTGDGKTSTTLHKSSVARILEQSDRTERKRAYLTYYRFFENHKNTLCTIYRTKVLQEIMLSKILGYRTTRARKLDEMQIDEQVHEIAISSIKDHVEVFHSYFALRKTIFGCRDLQPFDLSIPLISSYKYHYTYEEAVKIICSSLAILGDEYVAMVRDGLLHNWIDRTKRPNRRPGAFTATSYHGGPTIVMDYREDVLQSLFTLAHESAHAMHSYYSIRNNPFTHYVYSVLEAESISAVHEELLMRFLLDNEKDMSIRAFLLDRQLQMMTRRLMRQTMIADFEHQVFTQEEQGQPLTVADSRALYRSLLSQYHGPMVTLRPESDLEWLTVDHLFQPYYVYTYPVGTAVSWYLTDRIINGDSHYIDLLQRGESLSPMESLRYSGVDLLSDAIYTHAMKRYSQIVLKLTELIKPTNLST